VDGVLEVEHARIGFAHHQVARHVVTVHEDARLREDVREQPVEDAVEHRGLARVEFETQVAAEIPLREQPEFAAQERFVVRREHAFAARELPLDQRADGVVEQGRGAGVVALQFGEISRAAEVGEQQEAAIDVLGEHARCIHAGVEHEARDAHEGTDVLVLGWRVHDDPGVGTVRRAEVATETGVGGGGFERGCAVGQRGAEPAAQFGKTIQGVVTT
jgi:hypothetical protein